MSTNRGHWRTPFSRPETDDGERGQMLVIFGLLQVVFLVFIGFAVDYGLILLDRTRLQNAVDAASLAGGRALVDGPTPGVAAAQSAALAYLTRHGFQTNPETIIAVTFPPTPGSGAIESVPIQVNHRQPTYFIRLLGIDETTVAGQATAMADRRMVDVMLSLDLTGSMELSGTDDLGQLRRAVVGFINRVNPTTTDRRGPKVGLARFAGIMCGWWRGSPGDQWIDIGPGPSEYRFPCTDDKTVLTNLIQNKATLIKLADNTGAGVCPPGVSQYACPLVSWQYTAPVTFGSATTPLGLRCNGNSIGPYRPTYTGTKLPNGISVVSDTGYHAWSTANGGRNSASGEGWAHKVLVLITDGRNELWPETGNPVSGTEAWDTEVVTRANSLKLGPDGVVGTSDDVQIYVVGFFSTPYSTSTSGKWCKSTQAATPAPHPCPSASLPAGSAIDTLLWNVSSSSPGTCDRYFPIRKTEDLPQLFNTLAGSNTPGRLTQSCRSGLSATSAYRTSTSSMLG